MTCFKQEIIQGKAGIAFPWNPGDGRQRIRVSSWIAAVSPDSGLESPSYMIAPIKQLWVLAAVLVPMPDLAWDPKKRHPRNTHEVQIWGNRGPEITPDTIVHDDRNFDQVRAFQISLNSDIHAEFVIRDIVRSVIDEVLIFSPGPDILHRMFTIWSARIDGNGLPTADRVH